MKNSKNRVTLFSNGMVDFCRTLNVGNRDKFKISLPVKTSQVGDVLASLNVFGDVEIVDFPSFSPTSSEKELKISVENSLEDTLKTFSGAEVEIHQYDNSIIIGKIIGVESRNEFSFEAKEKKEVKYVIILTSDNFLRDFPIGGFSKIRLLDETSNSLLTKALERNYQKIKPESTFVNLSVKGKNENSKVVVRYVVPNSSWKVSYRIDKNENNLQLKGFAIVDNKTDEDWNNVVLSVVTGEPITFETDLAESKLPKRSKVNVVQNEAHGAVEATSSLPKLALPKNISVGCAPMGNINFGPVESGFGGGGGASGSSGGGWTIPNMISTCSVQENTESAFVADVEAKEVGDFSVFESKDEVTIAASKSAVVPILNEELNYESVLYYKDGDNKKNPYQSFKFENKTGKTLGRGVVTVYQDSVYSGSAIFPLTKQDEEQLMAFALETGVSIEKFDSNTTSETSKISLKNGILLETRLQQKTTSFMITNKKNEDFDLVVDVKENWPDSKIVGLYHGKEVKPERLNGISRFTLNKEGLSACSLRVEESKLIETSLQFAVYNFNQFTSLLDSYSSLKNHSLEDVELSKLISLYEDFSAIHKNIEEENNKKIRLEDRQNRVRENLKSVSASSEYSKNWMAQISQIDEQINEIDEKTVPALEQREEACIAKFEEQLKKVVFSVEL